MAGVAVAAGTLGLLKQRSDYERDQISVERVRVPSSKLATPKTYVFVSDLHDQEFGANNIRLIRKIKQINPDAILIGGDTMVTKSGETSIRVTQQLLESLDGIAPVYYGNGNHELRLWSNRQYETVRKAFIRALNRPGVHYLSDAYADLPGNVRVYGLNIERKFYRQFKAEQMQAADVQRHLGKIDVDKFNILLAHSPLFFNAYAAWGADVTLAGHFHGGVIRAPLVGGIIPAQGMPFPQYCGGTFVKGDRHMIVSRGLGSHTINLRLNNKPQLLVLECGTQ